MASDPTPQERFGKFILLRRLGTGGMANVFLAEMTGPGGFARHVALKRVLPHLSDNEEFLDAFISEARLGGHLAHPNIVQTLELGKEAGDYYLAMEYVDGLTLAQLLRIRRHLQAPLPLTVALDIVRQITEGLAYAHTAVDVRGAPLNMIHRDLKPANILISRYGVVKVSDFGVAKAESNLQHTAVAGQIKGTVAYMSPEQAASLDLDPRSDLYSLGALFFEILTLEHLYPSAGGLAALARVQRGDIQERIPLLKEFVPALRNLVLQLLQPERQRRPGSAREVRLALQSLIADQPPGVVDLQEIVLDALEYREAQSNQAWSEPSGAFLKPGGSPNLAGHPPRGPIAAGPPSSDDARAGSSGKRNAGEGAIPTRHASSSPASPTAQVSRTHESAWDSGILLNAALSEVLRFEDDGPAEETRPARGERGPVDLFQLAPRALNASGSQPGIAPGPRAESLVKVGASSESPPIDSGHRVISLMTGRPATPASSGEAGVGAPPQTGDAQARPELATDAASVTPPPLSPLPPLPEQSALGDREPGDGSDRQFPGGLPAHPDAEQPALTDPVPPEQERAALDRDSSATLEEPPPDASEPAAHLEPNDPGPGDTPDDEGVAIHPGSSLQAYAPLDWDAAEVTPPLPYSGAAPLSPVSDLFDADDSVSTMASDESGEAPDTPSGMSELVPGARPDTRSGEPTGESRTVDPAAAPGGPARSRFPLGEETQAPGEGTLFSRALLEIWDREDAEAPVERSDSGLDPLSLRGPTPPSGEQDGASRVLEDSRPHSWGEQSGTSRVLEDLLPAASTSDAVSRSSRPLHAQSLLHVQVATPGPGSSGGGLSPLSSPPGPSILRATGPSARQPTPSRAASSPSPLSSPTPEPEGATVFLSTGAPPASLLAGQTSSPAEPSLTSTPWRARSVEEEDRTLFLPAAAASAMPGPRDRTPPFTPVLGAPPALLDEDASDRTAYFPPPSSGHPVPPISASGPSPASALPFRVQATSRVVGPSPATLPSAPAREQTSTPGASSLRQTGSTPPSSIPTPPRGTPLPTRSTGPTAQTPMASRNPTGTQGQVKASGLSVGLAVGGLIALVAIVVGLVLALG